MLELVIAHRTLGVSATVLPNRLWVRPQLESLAERGLVTWDFDADANFRIESTAVAMRLDSARTLLERGSSERERGPRVRSVLPQQHPVGRQHDAAKTCQSPSTCVPDSSEPSDPARGPTQQSRTCISPLESR